jgi:hypothetical protein
MDRVILIHVIKLGSECVYCCALHCLMCLYLIYDCIEIMVGLIY